MSHNIIRNLPKHRYEIHHLGINYRGDPHEFDWKIYPAHLGGDLLGFGRIKDLPNLKPDGIFILNDVWVVSRYLQLIKETFKDKVPPIVVYFPVDSKNMDKEWFNEFDIVTKTVVYTDFGYKEVTNVYDKYVNIIPHGVDHDIFYKIGDSRQDIKKSVFGNKPDIAESFIVLNANRNQPRKRIDVTIKGFAEFVKDKPENIKLFLHMGLKDAGWDIGKLSTRYGINNRLILSNTHSKIQIIPPEQLNLLYNATDVGLNTSMGEGWSLTNSEHAATGAPQIVGDHSACSELYKDCGVLMPINQYLDTTETLVTSALVNEYAVADALNKLYLDKELYNSLADKALKKFSSKEYSWERIVREEWVPMFEDTF